MHRSEITIDLAAVRHNVRTLLDALGGAQLWAVVKANAYGHGASDVAGAALGAGASALCVATVPEALALRRDFPAARLVAMGPALDREVGQAREARVELVVSSEDVPAGVRVHVKLDTGMGRWGVSELTSAPALEVVGLMSHLATADADAAYAEWQIERFRSATAPYTHLERHIANSAAALRYPSAAFDAARCGIAVLGLSPFGSDPAEDGLRPVLGWTSHVAESKLLRTGQSTGYGRRFVAERDTWIGIVPVGYADGFRRELTGTTVRVGGEQRRVIGTVSMDAFAVELDARAPIGTPVVLVGRGVLVEDHARVADTIPHDLVCRINSDPSRARRVVLDS
jgi:alanine racemase